MRFTLIDRIIELRPGAQIRAVKSLSLAEEYLMDHFPRFPVMPGVLMLEALYQTSAWLVRASEDFAHSTVVMKEAKSVKYADFVEPGQTLTFAAEIFKQDEHTTTLKTRGTVGTNSAVSARLVLHRYNLADEAPDLAQTDRYTRGELRKLFEILYQPTASPDPVSPE